MRYIILDYNFVKTNDFYWQGLNLLSPQDTVQVICSDSDTISLYEKLKHACCPANIITSDSCESVARNCPAQEIVIISTKENYLIWQNYFENDSQKKIYRYASVEKYFSNSWKRQRNEVLTQLAIEDSLKEQVGFWVRRAYCIKDSGRRKYKTHNRLQNIIKNSRQLKEIYQAVKPFL